jgi:hypothetical protein
VHVGGHWCVQVTETQELQASLLEGLARALVSGGADTEAQTVMDRARDILREEPDLESGNVIEGQIRELEQILHTKD